METPTGGDHLADGAIPIGELCRRHVRLRLQPSLEHDDVVRKRPKRAKLMAFGLFGQYNRQRVLTII
jgi:hypothetical protein